jgi:hypothetical protein
MNELQFFIEMGVTIVEFDNTKLAKKKLENIEDSDWKSKR